MRLIAGAIACRCKGKKAKLCLYCLGAVWSLPVEHAIWEFAPGGMWFIQLIGLHI